jgi:hypothetical protein
LEKKINRESAKYAADYLELTEQEGADDYTQQMARKTISTWNLRKRSLKINEVHFSFTNRSLIRLLAKRGSALKMAFFA